MPLGGAGDFIAAEARARPEIEALKRAGLVTEVWDAALAAPPWDRPPVWIHGDLDSANGTAH
ncbi:hypothetical protein [Streptomyces sp. NPDC046727]|uniref:hypothetical protein n=1 Tax=Streptomyces sp. NPDC046727 TaxID=3155373 RepID=UPI0033FD6140